MTLISKETLSTNWRKSPIMATTWMSAKCSSLGKNTKYKTSRRTETIVLAASTLVLSRLFTTAYSWMRSMIRWNAFWEARNKKNKQENSQIFQIQA